MTRRLTRAEVGGQLQWPAGRLPRLFEWRITAARPGDRVREKESFSRTRRLADYVLHHFPSGDRCICRGRVVLL